MPQLTITIPCEGCCNPKFCHDLYGDTLQAAISGIHTCDGCYTINPGGGPQDVQFSFTGLNGMFTATWNAITSAWEVTIGTVTITFFASSNGSCTGATTTSTEDVVLSLTCQGENLFVANAVAGGALSVSVFDSNAATPVPFGDPMNSIFVLADCGSGSTIGAYGGTITLSV